MSTSYGSRRLVVGAHYGLRDWLAQRVTSLLMALFTVAVVVQIMMPGPLDYTRWSAISDGPVQATVTIGGKPVSVEHAWVVVAPPDYAPGIMAVVTMYDVIAEASAQLDPSVQPRVPSFTKDVAPIFV